MKKKIGQTLKQERIKLDLGKSSFTKFNLRHEEISSMERGDKSYTIDKLITYCEALGMGVNIDKL